MLACDDESSPTLAGLLSSGRGVLANGEHDPKRGDFLVCCGDFLGDCLAACVDFLGDCLAACVDFLGDFLVACGELLGDFLVAFGFLNPEAI